MDIYFLKTKINFGKYRGRTLEDVATENAMYIEWCILNVEFFVINKATANHIKKIYPRFLSSNKSNEILSKKLKEYHLIKEEKWRQDQKCSNDPYGSNWDNEYYNDGLDLDQQSPEWWDSL